MSVLLRYYVPVCYNYELCTSGLDSASWEGGIRPSRLSPSIHGIEPGCASGGPSYTSFALSKLKAHL